MSHHQHHASKLGTSLAAIGGPVAVLLALRFIMGSWTVDAPASMQPQAPIVDSETESTRPHVDLAAQKRALEWLATWKHPSTLQSAFDHPPAPPAGPDTSEQEVVTAGPRAEVIPPFTVSAIMGSSSGSMATINSKVYRVGDEPIAGWRIRTIDHTRKMVEIVSTSGLVIQRSPPDLRRKDDRINE